ncbi:MAG TPA: rhodanese-like domain-containing protein [Gaiellaceae bacterium]
MSDIALEELVERLGTVPIVDVRSPPEYDGSGGNACDPRQGHIPGARSFDVYRLLEMPTDDVKAELGLADGAEVIVYCHSGSRSSLAAQALNSIGYEARNYVGSWHEWSRHDELPLETGS